MHGSEKWRLTTITLTEEMLDKGAKLVGLVEVWPAVAIFASAFAGKAEITKSLV